MIIQSKTYKRLFINSLDYHRNGTFGVGYYRIQMSWKCEGKTVKGTAIVFDANEHIAILDSEGQSWRYEEFATELRELVNSDAGQQMAFPHLRQYEKRGVPGSFDNPIPYSDEAFLKSFKRVTR